MDIFRGEQYGIVYKRIMSDPRISPGAKGLYAYLSCFADEDMKCFPGNKTICKDMGISRWTIAKHLEELYGYGYLASEQENKGRFGKRILYFCEPSEWRK